VGFKLILLRMFAKISLLAALCGIVLGTPSAAPTTAAPTVAPGPAVNTFVEGSFKKGDVDDAQTIIKDGVAKSGQYLTRTDFYDVVYLWLNSQATMQTQDFNAVVSADPGLTVKAVTKNAPMHVFPFPKNTTYAEVQIRYTCPADVSAKKRFGITLDLAVIGYTSVQAKWQHDCSAPAGPTFNPPGMSGTEQFFLAIFIIGCVLCVGGCGYNYISRGKSGVEIIPFYHLLERYICCRKERPYNAGMSYDETIGDDAYSAQYQTDL